MTQEVKVYFHIDDNHQFIERKRKGILFSRVKYGFECWNRQKFLEVRVIEIYPYCPFCGQKLESS